MIPDPATIDASKSYVLHGQTYKDMLVVLGALWKMTNNNPNVLAIRTLNVCIGNTVYKTDVICSEPRLGA